MSEEQIDESNLGSIVVPTSISKSFQIDVVDEIYKIHVNEPIHEISNEFCKYFHADGLEDGLEYFAIVYDKQFNPSINVLQILKSNQIEHLNKVVTYSITKISYSKSTHLVVIVEKYDPNNNLGRYVEKNGPLSSDQISKKLIPQFTELLSQCEKLGINCGNINPYNIIIDGNDNFVLREFINNYESYEQPGYYLAPEISECVEIGRKIQGTYADIYALSISVFYCLTGKQLWSDYQSIHKYNEDRFEHTTFKLLLSKRKVSEYFKTFFKGTMNDSPTLRWKVRNISDWSQGSAPKISLYDKIGDNSNLIAFKGNNYSTPKSIAYAMFLNWDEAIVFIQDAKLLKWIKRTEVSDDKVNDIQALIGNEKTFKNPSLLFMNDRHNKLVKLLSLVDPEGAIRQQGLSFSTVSIPNMLHYFLVKNKRAQADIVLKALREKYWQTVQLAKSASYIDAKSEKRFEEVINYYSQSSPILGIERVVYSLNPNAACLSAAFANDYVINLADLLIALDKFASQSPEKLTLDRHIIGFIASKLNVENDFSFKILANFSKLSDHPLIQGLGVLNLAQQNEPNIKIPHLCNVIVTKVIELLEDYVHNVKFKEEISLALFEASKEGNLSKIIEVLNNPTAFIEDYNGYYKACREIQNLQAQIDHLGYEDRIYENALIFGQKMTVLISYMLCFVVTVILII